jgi:hypothetical protein
MADFDEGKEIGKLYAEMFPAHEEQLRSYPASAAPKDEEGRRIHCLYNEVFPPRKEGETNVTPEQQANVDKALSETQLSDKIGGASDVGGKPIPNEPAPLDKARDVGQDLHKAGVTMDRDK